MASATVAAVVIVAVLKVIGRSSEVYSVLCFIWGICLQTIDCGQTTVVKAHETCKAQIWMQQPGVLLLSSSFLSTPILSFATSLFVIYLS